MSVRTVVVIPFRDRGRDPLRMKNRNRVVNYWAENEFFTQVWDDGREGDAQFNRSAAYNRAVAGNPQADVFIFAESDMLVPIEQVQKAIDRARRVSSLVIPFTEYHYIGPAESASIRAGRPPEYADAQWIMGNRRAVGAVSVVSRRALEKVGRWDENFEGSWYDDKAMERAFHITCSRTRFITGPAFHLYHEPGWTGDHLTEDDKAATQRNCERYELYKKAQNPEEILTLTMGDR